MAFTAYEGLRVGQRAGRGYVHGATAKQSAYITTLLAERIHNLPYTDGSEVNIRHASRVIDHLRLCPKKDTAMTTTLTGRPATDKQAAFLRKLIAERNAVTDPFFTTTAEALSNGTLTTAQASDAIDRLLAMPRNASTAAAELEAGIYLLGDKVVKVQRAVHGSGNMYAKVLDPSTGKFDYTPGLIRELTADQRMTLEQARQYGAIYGVCCNCGRTLTNEDSIEAGIGPVCASRFL